MSSLQITLSRPDAEDFVRWILSEIATRTPSKHQKAAFVSAHMALQPEPKYLRGSDLSERLYVSVEALKRAGYSKKEALIEVAERAEKFLGRSKRGRPKLHATKPDFMSKVESIRSMVNAFARRKIYIDDVVDWRLDQFIFGRQIGTIEGATYVSDAGQKIDEAWQKEMRRRTFNGPNPVKRFWNPGRTSV